MSGDEGLKVESSTRTGQQRKMHDCRKLAQVRDRLPKTSADSRLMFKLVSDK
jgi:hypothetical protein